MESYHQMIMVITAAVVHLVGKAANQAQPCTAYTNRSILRTAVLQGVGSRVERQARVNDFNDEVVIVNLNSNLNNLLSPGACAVHSAVGHKFIHNQSKPVSKRFEKPLFNTELLDGGQEHGLILFGWGKNEFQLIFCGALFSQHKYEGMMSQ
jgi:hypothetical protein